MKRHLLPEKYQWESVDQGQCGDGGTLRSQGSLEMEQRTKKLWTRFSHPTSRSTGLLIILYLYVLKWILHFGLSPNAKQAIIKWTVKQYVNHGFTVKL